MKTLQQHALHIFLERLWSAQSGLLWLASIQNSLTTWPVKIFYLLEPSIRLNEPDIALTLALVNVNCRKSFASLRIVRIVALLTR